MAARTRSAGTSVSSPQNPAIPGLQDILKRPVIFVSGKGGVGKSVLTQAIAEALSQNGRRTLWVELENPMLPRGVVSKVAPKLWHLNCDAERAFEEYALLKIGDSPLARLFIDNKLMHYLAKAAPGIHELVLLGKIWHESSRYQNVVVDMPSTGHGLALFQSTKNYASLFRGGPIHDDAEEMIRTFADAQKSGHLILALPEEMPLQEALDLDQLLLEIFPQNRAAFVVNRVYPRAGLPETGSVDPATWASPIASNPVDYLKKRVQLEHHNLGIWIEAGIRFNELGYVSPTRADSSRSVVDGLTDQLRTGAFL